MDYISLNNLKHILIRKHGKQKKIKVKINDYFGTFVDKNSDVEYGWVDGTVYVPADMGWKLKKDLEKILNRPVHIKTKDVSSISNIKFYQGTKIKKIIQQRNIKQKKKREADRLSVLNDFRHVVESIKSEKNGYRKLGCFDLEFWEKDMKKILEFGWTSVDYKGKEYTKHIVVQENLNLKNGVYSKNNRFNRDDTQIRPLSKAMKKFDEFIDETDILIGHGLENDYKVLEMNDYKLLKSNIDLSDVGGIMMDKYDKISLEDLLDKLKIKHDNLHNAANDTEYIMKAFFELADL